MVSDYTKNRFNKEEISEFRKNLRKQRYILFLMKKENEALAESFSDEKTGEVSHIRLHPSDLATNAQLQDVAFDLSETETRKLQAVEAALGRLARGEFGRCSNCHLDIDTRRLKAIPEAAFCIDCEWETEIGSKKLKRPNVDELHAPSYEPMIKKRMI